MSKQVYLALNSNFLYQNPNALSWINNYSSQLNKQGLEVIRFDLMASPLPRNAVVHFFSRFDAETWEVLVQSGRTVIVTPGLDVDGIGSALSNVERNDLYRVFPLRIIRAILQRRWPPKDESFFRKAAHGYMVNTRSDFFHINKKWGVPKSKIILLSLNPNDAAKQAANIYSEFFVSREKNSQRN